MAVTRDSMLAWCETLLGVRERPWKTLADYLAAIPRLGTLADLPAGTPVLVRGDVDAKPGAKIGEGDIRLRSMVETLNSAATTAGSKSSSATSAASPNNRSRPSASGWANCSRPTFRW